MFIINESQGKVAKRRVLTKILGNEAKGKKAQIRLEGTFLRNGESAYDMIYSTDRYEFLSVTGVRCDGDDGLIEFTCVDDSDGTNKGMTWGEVAVRVTEDGLDAGSCESLVLKLVPDDGNNIDVMDREITAVVKPAEGGSGILTVGFGFEWWVTDSLFFEDWSDRLWIEDRWDNIRDEDCMDSDVADKIWDVAAAENRMDDVHAAINAAADEFGFDPEEDSADCLIEIVHQLGSRASASPVLTNPSRDRAAAKAILDEIPMGMTQDEMTEWFGGIMSGNLV